MIQQQRGKGTRFILMILKFVRILYCSHDFGEKGFKNLIKHMSQNGVTTGTHGNTGRLPKRSLSFDDTSTIVQFIKRYAQEFGLLQPAASNRKDSDPLLF